MTKKKNNPDFTFIIPNTRWHRHGQGRYWNHIPYPEGILTAVLRKNGFTVNHIDANIENYSEKELGKIIKRDAAGFVGISALSVEYRDAVHKTFEIVKKVKPLSKTVLGGVYPSISPEVAKKDPNLDFIIISEGENRLLKLLNCIKNKECFDQIDGLHYREGNSWKYNPRKAEGNVQSLDDLPFPDYSDYDTNKLFNWSQKYTQNFQFRQLPMTILMTSRGCVYKCTYCGAGKDGNPINDGIKRRSPNNVLDEIKFLVSEYGIREIIFVDDSLLLPPDRIISILKGITKLRESGVDLIWKSNNLDLRHVPLRKKVTSEDKDLLFWMKQSGCYQISISLESGSENTFKRMRRPTNLKHAVERLELIREYGFEEVASNFIIGMPGDSWNDILTTFEFADRIVNYEELLDYALFSIATPLPATELAEQAIKMGMLPKDFKPEEFYGFGKGVINSDEFSADELQMKRAMEWDRINFRSDRPEHHEKIARMLGITLDELHKWRQETRRNTGVQVQSADTTDEQYKQNTNLPNLFHQSTYSQFDSKIH